MRIGYAANGMPDYGADQMYQAAKNAGIQEQTTARYPPCRKSPD